MLSNLVGEEDHEFPWGEVKPPLELGSDRIRVVLIIVDDCHVLELEMGVSILPTSNLGCNLKTGLGKSKGLAMRRTNFKIRDRGNWYLLHFVDWYLRKSFYSEKNWLRSQTRFSAKGRPSQRMMQLFLTLSKMGGGGSNPCSNILLEILHNFRRLKKMSWNSRFNVIMEHSMRAGWVLIYW